MLLSIRALILTWSAMTWFSSGGYSRCSGLRQTLSGSRYVGRLVPVARGGSWRIRTDPNRQHQFLWTMTFCKTLIRLCRVPVSCNGTAHFSLCYNFYRVPIPTFIALSSIHRCRCVIFIGTWHLWCCLQVMNREARRLEKEIKEVLEEMSSDEEAKVGMIGSVTISWQVAAMWRTQISKDPN